LPFIVGSEMPVIDNSNSHSIASVFRLRRSPFHTDPQSGNGFETIGRFECMT
jgi:hypothetical protein